MLGYLDSEQLAKQRPIKYRNTVYRPSGAVANWFIEIATAMHIKPLFHLRPVLRTLSAYDASFK